MFDIPILRGGRPYLSKETLDLGDYATGEPVARLNLANPGLISRDLLRDAWTPLQELRVSDILAMLRKAAGQFMKASLPVGEDRQSPEEFVAAQCATTGLPQSLCRQNMTKIESAMLNMESILDGLTGGLDLDVLDAGYGLRDGHTVSYAPKARRFGAVLPANSPGVHALWLPAIALKMPLALKPGQREPWTPLRIIESLRAAGFPAEAFGFYPSGHDGAGVILRKCGASMMFGSGASVKAWLGDPRIEIHGPGYSKVLLGPRQGGRVARLSRPDRHVGFVQRRPVVHQRVERADAGLRPRIGRRRWPSGWPPFGRARAMTPRPCLPRSPIRPPPAASTRPSSAGSPKAARRTFPPASAVRSGWSSSKAARTCCPR